MKIKFFSLKKLVAASLAITSVISCTATNLTYAQEDIIEDYPLGGIEEDSSNWEQLPEDVGGTDIGDANALPKVVDLSSKFPVPKTQEGGTCTAWAIAYAMKSYQESQEHGWSAVNNSKTQFSPAFVYNQIPHYPDGTSIYDAMDCIIKKGACTIYDMPSNSAAKPNSYQLERASNYKAIKQYSVSGVENLKKQLAKGRCAAINVSVYPDFDNININNMVYDTISGKSRGRHNICVVGYDDNKKAFKFINSWGVNWGIDGFGYISYKMYQDKRNCSNTAYLMTDNTNQHYKKNVVGGIQALKDIKVYDRVDLKNSVGTINKGKYVKVVGFQKASDGNPPCFRVANGYITAKKDSVKQVNTYTIKYYPNGGSGTMSDTLIPYGIPTSIASNKFSKTGYTFKYWYANRDSDNKWYYVNNTTGKTGWYLEGKQPSGFVKEEYKDGVNVSKTSPVNKDIVRFFAQWKANKYTIIYNANGGTGTMSNTVVTYGVPTNIRENAFVRNGYTFNGWCAKRSSDSKWYYVNNTTGKTGWYLEGKQPSGFVKEKYKDGVNVAKTSPVNNDKVTFYAQWAKN